MPSLAKIALLLPACGVDGLKMGGHVQFKYQSAFTTFTNWASSNAGQIGGQTIVNNIANYTDTASMEAHVAKITKPGDADLVDVLVCPYTSGASGACIRSVDAGFTGPIMVWGGASNALFDTDCDGKNNCFGFFTPASDYTKTGLEALANANTGTLNVAIITNSNSFSKSVADGAKTTIAGNAKLSEQSFTELSAESYKKALTTDDQAKIDAAMAHSPDVVVICGHSGDVEPTVAYIGANGHRPKAILATNSITTVANYGAHAGYAKAVMMPDQWGFDTSATDPVVGWTIPTFATAMGGYPTYHQAAAGAVGVAIANALSTNGNPAALTTTLRNLDVNSFYGKLKWDANGRIQKPMYTKQRQDGSLKVVAPTGSQMQHPLRPYWPPIMGGQVQGSYQAAMKLWPTSGDKMSAFLKEYNATTLAADVMAMTTPGGPNEVEVLVCPYTSGATQKCVDAVNVNYTGPVMVWGGASDAIFSTNCARLKNKNCFGFFTPASKYTETGLAKLSPMSRSPSLKVALITNSNGFSKSVIAGAKATIEGNSKLLVQSETTLTVAKTALEAEDKASIKAALEQNPDIVVIAGHNKDVEPAVEEIGKNGYRPKAILATNSINALENYAIQAVPTPTYAKCVMMPTQWDDSTAAKDSVVGWDSAAFHAAMGGTASYQKAAAGAVGVALANAMGVSGKTLLEAMKSLDVDSFYGKLKWDANGVIQKPMYTLQREGGKNRLVAPDGSAIFSLLGGTCWGSAPTSAPTGAPAGAPAGNASSNSTTAAPAGSTGGEGTSAVAGAQSKVASMAALFTAIVALMK